MSPISKPSSLFPLPHAPAVPEFVILSLCYNSFPAGLHASISFFYCSGSQTLMHIRNTWGSFQKFKDKTTPHTIKSELLGLEPKHQYFLKPPVDFKVYPGCELVLIPFYSLLTGLVQTLL